MYTRRLAEHHNNFIHNSLEEETVQMPLYWTTYKLTVSHSHTRLLLRNNLPIHIWMDLKSMACVRNQMQTHTDCAEVKEQKKLIYSERTQKAFFLGGD